MKGEFRKIIKGLSLWIIILLCIISEIQAQNTSSLRDKENKRNLKLYSFPAGQDKIPRQWASFPQSIPALTVSKPLKLMLDRSIKKPVNNRNRPVYSLGVAGTSYVRIYHGYSLNGKELRFVEQFNSPNTITDIAFHPTKQIIAYSDNLGNITLREIKGYKTPRKLGSHVRTKRIHNGTIHSIAFTPDGRYLISGGSDYTVRAWDLLADQTHTLYHHKNEVSRVTVHPGGDLLASAGYDRRIILYNLKSKDKWLLRSSDEKNPGVHTNWITDLAFSPKESRIVSGGYDGQLVLWDISDLKKVSVKLIAHMKTAILRLRFNPSGDSVVTSGLDGRIIEWGGSDLTSRSHDYSQYIMDTKKEGIGSLLKRVHYGSVRSLVYTSKAESGENYLISASNQGILVVQKAK
ncbi:MAG: hypothetical protein IEMM0008_1503 [bacterium]|nr:MAG: hypothetical protein IEMM0008_1503 [bacterium]